jgi:hypothetical protein
MSAENPVLVRTVRTIACLGEAATLTFQQGRTLSCVTDIWRSIYRPLRLGRCSACMILDTFSTLRSEARDRAGVQVLGAFVIGGA